MTPQQLLRRIEGELYRRGQLQLLEKVRANRDQVIRALRPPGDRFAQFSQEGAPTPQERGYRPAPARVYASSKMARQLLRRALSTMEEPEAFWGWSAAESWRVMGEPLDDEKRELLEDWLDALLMVPYRLPGGRELSLEDRADLGLLSSTLALRTVEGAAVPGSFGHAAERQQDQFGRLPLWAAETILADALQGPGQALRIVNVPKDRAVAFVKQHHSKLPYVNPRGLMYALGAMYGDRLVAVATANTPSAGWKNQGDVLELSRIASDGTVKGASSALAARLIDITDRSGRGDVGAPTLFVTYSLADEAGTTYKALAEKGLRATRFLAPKKRPSGQRAKADIKASLANQPKIVWEAGPRAAPAVPWGDLQAQYRRWRRANAPAPVYFASGSNHRGEIMGFAELGQSYGIAANQCWAGCEEAIIEAYQRGHRVPVFVDSGAFGEVDRNLQVIRPMTPEDWGKVLGLYERLGRVLGSSLYVVAPDRVGDQEKTLERLERYAPELRGLQELGVNVIVPLQHGAMTSAEMARRVDRLLGRGQYIAGFAATDKIPTGVLLTGIRELLSQRDDFQGLHLLGLGERSRRKAEVLGVIEQLAPGLPIYMDSVKVVAHKGRTGGPGGGPRRLTLAEDKMIQELAEYVRDALPGEAMDRDVGDFTDAMGDPEGYFTTRQLRAIGKAAGLNAVQQRAWVADPIELRQELSDAQENLLVLTLDEALEAEWYRQWERKTSGEKKRRAIKYAFGQPVLYLVACAAQKQDRPAPAGDLYTSDLFRKSRRYVLSKMDARPDDRWAILSAKHGLVEPTEVIAPYDVTLATAKTAQRRSWAEETAPEVLDKLQAMEAATGQRPKMVLLAGRSYRQFLTPLLAGYDVEVPMEGLGIGHQKQWLAHNTLD